MLDVHVLLNPHISDAWFEQCIQSLVQAEGQSPFPITISMHDPVPGHVGKARKRAFAAAEQPYVSFLDPDDWITPDTFVRLAPSILEDVDAARTAGKLVMPNGKLIPHVVGFFICKKEIAMQVDWDNRQEACSREKMCGTCELQRIANPRFVEGHCYYRRYGYGSWASKNQRKN